MKTLNLQLTYDEKDEALTLELLDNSLSTLETVGILEMLRQYVNFTNLLELTEEQINEMWELGLTLWGEINGIACHQNKAENSEF